MRCFTPKKTVKLANQTADFPLSITILSVICTTMASEWTEAETTGLKSTQIGQMKHQEEQTVQSVLRKHPTLSTI